ncbi:MAG: xanthine dehydrogenase family protein subunit M, partial [Actinomycetota bacterium]
EELYARVGAIAAENASPATDTRGTAAYKTHLAKELTIRSLRSAVARIQGGN